mgnify:CR=1 FL=1|tara:strand:+ start:183612 stop:183878 length:267 start_codon:yes stop_codon:yes gene_type:complete
MAKKRVIRKKTQKKSIVRRPKKKTTTKKKVVKPKKAKAKPKQYIKVSINSKHSKFVEVGKRVQEGEVQWSRYVVEGNIGYHYYLILKK